MVDVQKEFGKTYGGVSPSVYDYSSSLRDTPESNNFVDAPIKQRPVDRASLPSFNIVPLAESTTATFVDLLPTVPQTNIALNPSFVADIQPQPVVKSHPRNVPIAPKKRIHFFSKEMGMCDDSSISGPTGTQPVGPTGMTTTTVNSLTPMEDGMAELQYLTPSSNPSNLTSSTVHHLPLIPPMGDMSGPAQRCALPPVQHSQQQPSSYQIRPDCSDNIQPTYSTNAGGFANSRPIGGSQHRTPLITPQLDQCSQDGKWDKHMRQIRSPSVLQESYRPQKVLKSEGEFYAGDVINANQQRDSRSTNRNLSSGANVQFPQPNLMGVCGPADMKPQNQPKLMPQHQVFVTTGGMPAVINQSRNSSVVRPVPINLLSPGRSDSSAFSSISPCSSGSSPLSPPQMRLAGNSVEYSTANNSNNTVAFLGSTNSPNFVQVMVSIIDADVYCCAIDLSGLLLL